MPIAETLYDVHRSLVALLDACLTPLGAVDPSHFAHFREVLLTQIAIEERVLMPALVRRLGKAPVFQNGLRRDHEALISLCLTVPDGEWLDNLRGLLMVHQQLEEEADGFYALVAQQLDDDEALATAIAAVQPVVLHQLTLGRGSSALLAAVLEVTGLKKQTTRQ